MSKTAVLAYQYGMENAGDFAITLGALDFLLPHYDQVIVMSRYTEHQEPFQTCSDYLKALYGDRIVMLPGVFALDRGSMPALLKSYAMGAMRLLSPHVLKKSVESCKDAAHIYLNGGNLMRCASFTDWVRLKAVLYPIRMAEKLRVPYTFLPLSTTVVNDMGYSKTKRDLLGADKVITREEISREYLQQRFPGTRLVPGIDMAFCIEDRPEQQQRCRERYPKLFQDGKPRVALTLRREKIGDIGTLTETEIHQITEKIKAVIALLLEQQYQVCIVVQTQKDLAFSQEIAGLYAENVTLIEEYDVLILREIYKRMELLVGMRLHSIILASSVGTPTLGVFAREWGKKNPGIMQQLSMPYGFLEDDLDWNAMLASAKQSAQQSADAIRAGKAALARALGFSSHAAPDKDRKEDS